MKQGPEWIFVQATRVNNALYMPKSTWRFLGYSCLLTLALQISFCRVMIVPKEKGTQRNLKCQLSSTQILGSDSVDCCSSTEEEPDLGYTVWLDESILWSSSSCLQLLRNQFIIHGVNHDNPRSCIRNHDGPFQSLSSLGEPTIELDLNFNIERNRAIEILLGDILYLYLEQLGQFGVRDFASAFWTYKYVWNVTDCGYCSSVQHLEKLEY